MLGWQFIPGSRADAVHIDDIVPMSGLWAGGPAAGAILAFRMDDINAAGQDDQGLPFYLHELPAMDDGGSESAHPRTARSRATCPT